MAGNLIPYILQTQELRVERCEPTLATPTRGRSSEERGDGVDPENQLATWLRYAAFLPLLTSSRSYAEI